VAGPTVVVRFLGDLLGLQKAAAEVGTVAQNAAGKAHTAFSGMLGALNQAGVLGPFSGMLQGVDNALQTVAEHGKAVGPAMLGVGAALAGIGAGLTAMGDKDRAAHQQLQAAVQATGHDYEDYAKAVEQAISKQERYGHTANETQDALRVMTQAFGDPKKALDELGLAANLAAAKHESLSSAATQVARAANGSAKILKEYGIAQKDAAGHVKSHDEILTELAAKLSGQASASADTFSGRIRALKATVEDSAATFGQKYGPVITAAGTAMAGLGAAMTVLPAIFGAVSAVWAALTAIEWASLWPILAIVAAVALLGVGIYLLVTHWHEIWAAIKSIVMDVWHWIEKNWPLLLGILLGPIYLAAAIIWKFFGKDIKAWVAEAIDWIKGAWNDLVNFFTGLPGRLAGIFSGMWHGIYDAFHGVLNSVIDLWNQLHFTLPKVDVLGVHVGGETIGVPTIPHLAAGGVVTAPTLALLGERGPEAVVPLGQGMGPAVHIQSATFNDPVDVDMLMRKTEFAVSAGRL
jgi:hypothetical protein